MPENQKIAIAGGSYLLREGLKGIVKNIRGFSFAGECDSGSQLFEMLLEKNPSLLILNYAGEGFDLKQVKKATTYFPTTRILAITVPQSKEVVAQAISAGILSHLLIDCGKDEII